MEQGVYLGETARKKGGETVTFDDELQGDSQCSPLVVEGDVVDDTAYDGSFFYSLAPPVTHVSSSGESLIRALDIVGSFAMLVLAAPLMLVIAVLIKLLSPGSILYKQKRVGQNGKIFTLLKFRTMINDAEEHTGPVWAAKEDSRVTPIGGFLRKTRLDELPQLFNVLRGDMSLVGPRPERPHFVGCHKVLQGVRLTVKPGLTGLAQIRSFYDLKPHRKMRYDYLYIQKRSFMLNIYILLKTVPVIFLKKGW